MKNNYSKRFSEKSAIVLKSCKPEEIAFTRGQLDSQIYCHIQSIAIPLLKYIKKIGPHTYLYLEKGKWLTIFSILWILVVHSSAVVLWNQKSYQWNPVVTLQSIVLSFTLNGSFAHVHDLVMPCLSHLEILVHWLILSFWMLAHCIILQQRKSLLLLSPLISSEMS